jgi:hypothetical protein
MTPEWRWPGRKFVESLLAITLTRPGRETPVAGRTSSRCVTVRHQRAVERQKSLSGKHAGESR